MHYRKIFKNKDCFFQQMYAFINLINKKRKINFENF